MLRSTVDSHAHSVYGSAIQANDGEAGRLRGLFFDDRSWAVRYLVVACGEVPATRMVLVAPDAVEAIDRQAKAVYVALTREQVERGRGIEADPPVAAQRGIQRSGWTPYPTDDRGYTGLAGAFPDVGPNPGVYGPATGPDGRIRAAERGDPHLRSTQEVVGYRIQAADGEIGHVEDFVVDDEGWKIRYVAVDTRNWLPGKKVLTSPRWVSGISWTEGRIRVDLGRDEIRGAPEWDPLAPIDREYEARLHEHYGRTPYWADE